MGRVAGGRRSSGGAPGPGIAGIVHEIQAEVARCHFCPGLKPWKKLSPEAFGTTTTGYMIVGEAPGEGARPFDDRGGRLLRDALREVGDQRYRELEELFFLAHAVRCRPVDTRLDRRRAPSKAECAGCRPYLALEMRALHPELVLAIGTHAAEAVLERPVKLKMEHGARYRVETTEVIPLLVPSPSNTIALGCHGYTLASYRTWLTGLFGTLIEQRG